MRISRTLLLFAVASLPLFAGAALAQSRTAANTETRTIQVPKGAVVIVLPAGMTAEAIPQLDAAFPFVAMPDPASMLRRVEQMMGEADTMFDGPAMSWPVSGVPGGASRFVSVTTFSDGHGTCTRRVSYAGAGAAPKVEVSASGDADCGPLGGGASATRPAASPGFESPAAPAVAPRTWRVENRTPPRSPQPTMVAQLSD